MIPRDLINPPEVNTILGFLVEKSTLGIYIPAYQRPFSWETEQFVRFFEDVVSDIKLKKEPPHYGTFLGFIICYDDSEKKYVTSGAHNEQPLSVYNIVDGQQRVIFVTVLSVLLRHLLASRKFKKIIDENEWFRERAEDLQNNLERVITVDIRRNLRPKIIRALDDEWSSNKDQEKCKSGIASFLKNYLDTGSIKRQKGAGDKHLAFMKQVEDLNNMLVSFCKQEQPPKHKKEVRYELGDLDNYLENEILMKAIFSSDSIQDDYREGRFDFEGNNGDEKEELFRALLLGNYLYHCIHAIIVVTTKSYGITFAIFDALNSTGIPLNAFDTFKPEVIKLDIHKYPSSSREGYINRINNDIEKFKSNRKKVDKYVRELIISFALANSGEKIGTDLFGQRDYMRRTFEAHANDEKQYLEYLKFFSTVNDMKRMFEDTGNGLQHFLDHYHPGKKPPAKLGKEACFCLRFLSKAGFTITISHLSIYLHQIHVAEDADAAIAAFCDAVCKVAAFCAIWRSSSESTNRIDDRLRQVMKEVPVKGKVMNWRPLARYDYAKLAPNALLGPDELGGMFIDLITDMYGIKDGTSWSSLVEEIEIYKIKHVTRFILLVGCDNTRVRVDNAEEPYLIDANGSVKPMVAVDSFDDLLFKSIEHIIPITESYGASELSIKEKNQLWNLTLVPMEVNSMLSNRPWECKQAIYRCFSAEDEEERAKCLGALKEHLTNVQIQKIKDSPYGYLATTRYLAMPSTDGYPTREDLAPRTKYILHRCWNTLAKGWLGWTDKP